jgi:hypothetical protein
MMPKQREVYDYWILEADKDIMNKIEDKSGRNY